MQRRERVILGIGAALAAAVPLALAAHVRTRCADDLGARLTALTGLPSRIGGVEAGLTGTVRLTDVAIGELFAARAIEARVALPNLLAGRLTADEVQVEAPRLRARVVGSDVDLVRVMRRIAARRSHGSTGGLAERSVRRIVVTEGDLVIDVDGRGTVSASGVELHPQPGGVRVVTTAVRVHAAAAAIALDAGFTRAAADVALPAVRLDRLVATGGTMRVSGAPASLAVGAATLTYGMSGPIAMLDGEVDDAGIPRPVRVAIARDAAAITLDHVPLAAAGGWLPAGIDLRTARLTGTVGAARAATGVSITARGELTGAAIQSGAIADRWVPIDVGGELTTRWGGGRIDADGELTTGKARVAVSVHLDRGVTGWDHGTVAVTVPTTPCVDLLDAIPRALRGATAGLTVDGDAAARVELELRGTATDPDHAVELGADVDVAGCHVLAEAPAGDPARLATTREHVFPDGSRATIGPDREGWVRLADLPAHVGGAFVAAEDARFWVHHGFDQEQIARSLEVDLREHRFARGGSTISQQLVKNVFLGSERTFARKLEEAILTWRVEATTGKRAILEQYLNLIELGPGVFGIEAAAEHWFGKHAAALTTREAAFLAAMTPEPRSMTARIAAAGRLDRRSADRVDVVLRAMKRAGVIDADRFDRARDAGLDLRRAAVTPP